MSNLQLNITAGQGHSLVPEAFQQQLIDSMSVKLLITNPSPCLLRAPTGSGKTFVLSKVLGSVSDQQSVIWFWFVPYANLVHQTLDALISNAGDLAPVLFADGLNQDPQPGQVLISTTQGVSKAAWRKMNYNTGGGEQSRTAAEFQALVKAKDIHIGVVVDEAHIALDHATEFGQFVKWLDPLYLVLATATPNSDRITQFLASAEMSSFESFNVSRDDVVRARLNKAYIEAVVYDLRQATSTIADLKRTVLRQAWLRNLELKRQLAEQDVPLVPLLLVQVENGPHSIEEAERDLVELCRVPPQAIGKHSSDEPNPQMMDAIANDTSKEVLIFKQSAGTGFDAPRAFVLASTKSVNDPDFAMQFIGRVMRVTRQIRAKYASHDQVPSELNTAYVYLANAEAQLGYQQAVQMTDSVQTQLEGQVEKMMVRTTRSGATLITNRPTDQLPISSRLPLPNSPGAVAVPQPSPQPVNASSTTEASREEEYPTTLQDSSEMCRGTQSLFDESELDVAAPFQQSERRPQPQEAQSRAQWEEVMRQRGIELYPRRTNLPGAVACLKKEARPSALDMAEIVKRVATRLEIQESQLSTAVLAARGRLEDLEIRTELTRREVVGEDYVHILIDRNRLAAEARSAMMSLPQVEEADHRLLIDVLAARVMPRLRKSLMEADVSAADNELQKMARTAAFWIIRGHVTAIDEALHLEIAAHAQTVDAEPLPDVMLFPTKIALRVSSKNLYGILPPSKEDLGNLEHQVLVEDRALLVDKEWHFTDTNGHEENILTGRFDTTFSLNPDELMFAKALDRAPFVVWWFRNPDKKPYSVRIVRGDHRNSFYPDFVVCLSHVDGAEPIQRLIETKHDVKDAQRKARHTPSYYGKVLFLTRDGGKYRIVTEEGTVGKEIDPDNLETLREALQRTAP